MTICRDRRCTEFSKRRQRACFCSDSPTIHQTPIINQPFRGRYEAEENHSTNHQPPRVSVRFSSNAPKSQPRSPSPEVRAPKSQPRRGDSTLPGAKAPGNGPPKNFPSRRPRASLAAGGMAIEVARRLPGAFAPGKALSPLPGLSRQTPHQPPSNLPATTPATTPASPPLKPRQP